MKRTAGERGCLISLLAVFLLLLFIWNRCSRKELINQKFSGIVKSIEHSSKRTPSIEIKGQMYVIPSVEGDVLVGDSLVKKANTTVIYQYRKGEFINEYSW